MRKDIEWLKNRLTNTLKFEAQNDREIGCKVAMEEVIELINQLDEPEVLSQEWIDRNKEPFHHFETKKVDYYVSTDFLQNLLVPEQEVIERHGMSESEWAEVIDRYKWHLEQEGYVVIEKPTIPQFVADYTEEYKGWNDDEEFYDEDNASDLFNAMDFDNAGMSDKVQDYLVDNLETFARAWLDGYEVEEEPIYIIDTDDIEISDGNHYLTNLTLSKDSVKLPIVGDKFDAIRFDDINQAEAIASYVCGRVEELEE